jgi:putative ABC transport system permease protein
MLKNYLKITVRNFKKNILFSVINIFGLAIGLACCMLIAIYIHHELAYDQHYSKGSRIYRVGTEFKRKDSDRKALATPAPLGPALLAEYPEIESMARSMPLFAEDKTLLQYTDTAGSIRSFYETKGYLADSTFLRIFDYDFTEGNPLIALDKPYTIVLSNEIAKKIFGDQPALNKTIMINSTMNGAGTYKITGVFDPPKRPSHIDARFLMSMRSGNMGNFVSQATNFANNNMFNTYLLLKEKSDAKALESKFPAFVEKYMRKDLVQQGTNKQQFLIQLKDLHLRSGVENTGGNLSYLYILGSIAVFILVIACINFMNLATSRSAKRASEVGVRKVLGAERKALIFQFLSESILYALGSFLLAIGLTFILLPVFGTITGTHLSLSAEHIGLFGSFIIMTIIAGLLAGSYPALYLSAFKPIRVLKGKFSNSLAAASFRKALVVFQFTVSAALIIAALVIGRQMKYMQSKDLGFERSHQVVIPLRSSQAKNISTSLKQEISRSPQVLAEGASQFYPGIFNPSDFFIHREGVQVTDATLTRINYVDHSFLQTLNIQPVAGRLFGPDYPADTSFRLILNETAAKNLGFASANEAINKPIIYNFQDTSFRFEIIGVVKDFNFESLQRPITPFCFQNRIRGFNYIIARIKPGNIEAALQHIRSSWNKLNPNEPFEYSFLDQDFQKNYEAETRLASLISYFMIIAICICCLGLFGLVAFSAEQRTKEIGVRKVLGAGIPSIIGLLSKDFIKLVLIGNILAIPLAYYVMNKWLQEFAFPTSLAWWIFGTAIILSVVIAFVTLSFHALKAAIANPVKSLRTE